MFVNKKIITSIYFLFVIIIGVFLGEILDNLESNGIISSNKNARTIISYIFFGILLHAMMTTYDIWVLKKKRKK